MYVVEYEKEDVYRSIVLVGRQHPPEVPGGFIGFKFFFENLLSNSKIAKEFRKKYNIYAFPLVNPDGVDLGNWRHNSNGVDLNRDWIDFSQPETINVKKYILDKVKSGRKIIFALDFHTSYSGPYLLVLDSLNSTKTNNIISKWVNNIEDNSNLKVEIRKRSQELPYCYNWFYNSFGSEAVTYENGDEENRDTIAIRAQVYSKELMKTIINILNK